MYVYYVVVCSSLKFIMMSRYARGQCVCVPAGQIDSLVGEGTVFLVTARVRIMARWTWEGPRKGRIGKANVFFV